MSCGCRRMSLLLLHFCYFFSPLNHPHNLFVDRIYFCDKSMTDPMSADSTRLKKDIKSGEKKKSNKRKPLVHSVWLEMNKKCGLCLVLCFFHNKFYTFIQNKCFLFILFINTIRSIQYESYQNSSFNSFFFFFFRSINTVSVRFDGINAKLKRKKNLE